MIINKFIIQFIDDNPHPLILFERLNKLKKKFFNPSVFYSSDLVISPKAIITS